MVDLRIFSCMLDDVSGKLKFFLLFILLPVFSVNADVVYHTPYEPDIINSDVTGGTYSVVKDVVVAPGVLFAPDVLEITSAAIIENNGTIQSNIKIGTGNMVIIKNSGQINADFDMSTGASLYHVISAADEVGSINFGVDYSVFVESNEPLSLADIIDAANGANEVVLKKTKVVIDELPSNKSVPVKLGEGVVFVVNDIDGIETTTVLENVISSGGVRFEDANTNAMYSSVVRLEGGKLYLDRVRDEEYTDIIENENAADFVESLPNDDALFDDLDAAIDTNEINKIMSKSVRFNRDILRKPLQIINSMNLADIKTVTENKVGVAPFGILSDDFYLYGANARANLNLTDALNVGVGAYVAKLNYESNYDDFGGLIYGLNLSANYFVFDNIFLRSGVGFSYADFDVDSVFYDNKIIDSPSALFGYFVTDAGYRAKFDNGFAVLPFVGLVGQYYDVEGELSSKYFGRVGTGIEYKHGTSGLEYKYGIDLFVNTNGATAITGKIGFLSVLDSVGGHVDLTVLRDEDMWSYKTSVNAKLLF